MGPIDLDFEAAFKAVFVMGVVGGAAIASGIYFSYRCCTKPRPQPREEEFLEETPATNLKQISRQDARAARRRHSAPPEYIDDAWYLPDPSPIRNRP